jgi:hypothetical protein
LLTRHGELDPGSRIQSVDGIWRRKQMADAMAMRMFSRGVIVGLFIGLYIGWMNWAS